MALLTALNMQTCRGSPHCLVKIQPLLEQEDTVEASPYKTISAPNTLPSGAAPTASPDGGGGESRDLGAGVRYCAPSGQGVPLRPPEFSVPDH